MALGSLLDQTRAVSPSHASDTTFTRFIHTASRPACSSWLTTTVTTPQHTSGSQQVANAPFIDGVAGPGGDQDDGRVWAS